MFLREIIYYILHIIVTYLRVDVLYCLGVSADVLLCLCVRIDVLKFILMWELMFSTV